MDEDKKKDKDSSEQPKKNDNGKNNGNELPPIKRPIRKDTKDSK